MSLPESERSGVEQVDGALEIFDVLELEKPATFEGEFSLGEAVVAIIGVKADLAGVVGIGVDLERLQVGVVKVMKPERILEDTKLPDLAHAAIEGIGESLIE